MENTKTICIILFFAIVFLPVCLVSQPNPVGWASVNGGTTGGYGGDAVVISSRQQFVSQVLGNDPKILLIRDTIDLVLYERIKVYSNKTIVGMTQNAMIRFGGLEIVGDNVIVQNLIMGDFYDGDWDGKTHSTDCLTIYGKNIWIDHCWLHTAADGLLDIRTDGSLKANYITVSNVRFSDHNKVSLIGSSDDSTQDRDHLNATFHHCWFDGTLDKSVNQRMPRVRYGDVHVFNCYYEGITSSCVAARIESDVVVEKNYFRRSANPHSMDDFGKGLEDPDLVAVDNHYELTSGSKMTSGNAFDPSDFYGYTPDPVWDVPALVMNEAGPFNPFENQDPVAVTDTVDYRNLTGAVILDVTSNDLDADGGELRLAQMASTPRGIAFIRENKIYYAPPAQANGIDTLFYMLVDTRGGLDTGMVLIFYDGINTAKDLKKSAVPINLYPNPAADYLWIDLGEAAFDLDGIWLYDSLGTKRFAKISPEPVSPGHWKIDVSAWEEGIYSLTVRAGGQTVTKKMTIFR